MLYLSKLIRLFLILISCLSKRKEEPTAVTYTAELSIRTYPLTAGAEVVPVIASSPCKAPVSLAILSGMNGFTISNGKAVMFIFPSR